MTKKTRQLELLQIPKPCPSDWENMIGNERKRYCTECHKYVYNLSAMTRREAEVLIEDSQGKVCARFTRLPDGQILTHEPPITLHRINRRPSPIAAALVTALISLSPAVAAPQSSHTNVVTQAAANKKKPSAPPNNPTASLSGIVGDYQNAAIVGAKVTLTSEGSGETQATVVGEDGGFRFAALRDGVYIIKVEAAGFTNSETHGITLRANESQNLNMTMAPALALNGEIVTPEHPLRNLYTNSDRVVIAGIGESAVIDSEGESKT